MIFSQKLVMLRKKNGWSQEELAEKVNVSRQAVSKWEGAQSVPDLEKILQLSKIFGVTTDYLIKDEIEEEESTDVFEDSFKIRKITLEEANDFLSIKIKTAKQIAFATLLCILSPIALFLLGSAVDTKRLDWSENAAGGVGVIILLVFVSVAVSIFISCEGKTSKYKYLENEVFETEYGVVGMVNERKKQFHDTYARYNIIGTIICICSLIPLFATCIFTEDDFYLSLAFCGMLVMVGIAVQFLIIAGMYQENCNKLLQEGEFKKNSKEGKKTGEAIATIYWLLTIAIYLAIGFKEQNWKENWIIWPIAGILFGAVMIGYNAFRKSK